MKEKMATDTITLLNLAVELRTRYNSMMERSVSGLDLDVFTPYVARMNEWDEKLCPENMGPVLKHIRECPNASSSSIIDHATVILFHNVIDALYSAVKTEAEIDDCFKKWQIEAKSNKFSLVVPQQRKPFIGWGSQDSYCGPFYTGNNTGNTLLDNLKLKELEGLHPENVFVGDSDDSGIYVHIKRWGCFSVGKYSPSIAEVKSYGAQRFKHTFQTEPTSDTDIVQTLRVLNNFSDDRINWKLEERVLADFPQAPRGAKIWHDEARKAQDKGLFSKVQVYELIGKRMPVSEPVTQTISLFKSLFDPVIVGIDHFGQKYPMFYWRGDEGVKNEKSSL